MNARPSEHDASLSPEACWRALCSRDARFDGHFFTGVTSTGIYCRPVCAVRTPRRENCRFFRWAAQAEAQGFRPCLRCRPELAPGGGWSTQDAGSVLAVQALRLIDTLHEEDLGAPGGLLVRLAQRLGVSDRHLRRLFEAQWGVSPLQYLQTQRLLAAKQLLTDTGLPVAQVATLAGFGSVRRFNAAFAQHYRLNPTQLRASLPARSGPDSAPAGTAVRLAYRPPLDVRSLLQFFATRALPGVEVVDPGGGWMARTVSLRANSPGGSGASHAGWIRVAFDPVRHHATLQVSASLVPALPAVIQRARHWLDLDADPQSIDAVLRADFPGRKGLRLPGAMDGFELAVRAVLGQQVTVAAARTFARRLVERFGQPLPLPAPGLDRLFPSPQALAHASGEDLGALGIVRQRQAALRALADAVCRGELALHAGADPQPTMDTLRSLPGIGDWTAHYIAMRALRWPDAFPAGDVALHKALGLQGRRDAAREALRLSQPWSPWRGYAVLRAWHGMAP